MNSENGFMAFSALFTSFIVLMAVPSNIITIQAELNPVQAQAAIVESAESKGLGTVNPPPAVADAPSVTDAPPAGAVPGTVHGVPPVQSVPVLREAVSPPAVQGGTGHITEFNVKPAPVVRQDIVADSVKAAVADVEKRAPVKASVPAPQATEAARVNNPVSGGQPVVEAAQKPVTLRGEGWTEVEIPAVESRAVPDAEPRDIVANGRLNEPVPLVVALEENPVLRPLAGIVTAIVSFLSGNLPAVQAAETNETAGFILEGTGNPKNILEIGAQQIPEQMEMDIRTNKADLWADETLNITVTAVNNGPKITVDRYVLLHDGTRFYYFDGEKFTTGVSSFRETYDAGQIKSKKIISYKISDSDPPGTFTLYAGFTRAGTADIISNVSQAEFKIKGGSTAQNRAPSITVSSHFPPSVKRGNAITFTANWSDPDPGERVKLLVCRSSGRADDRCRGEAWCYADYSQDNPKTCSRIIPEDMAVGNYDYFAYVCDDGGLCSDYKKGTFNVDAGQPPPNRAPSVTSVSSSPEPIPLDTTVTFTTHWSDPDSGDRVKTLICGMNALSGTNCAGTGQEWCAANYSSTSPSTCQKFFPPGSSLGTFSYYAFACDDEGLCSQGMRGQVTIIKPDSFGVSISPSGQQTHDSGVPITFTAIPSGGTPDGYQWAISPTAGCAPLASTTSQFTVTCTNNGPTDAIYSISLTAWKGSDSANAGTTLRVKGGGTNTAPTAEFTVNPSSGKVTETQFSVDASGSHDAQDSPGQLQVHWKWGDGTESSGWTAEKGATHTYGSEGTKTITLQVKDSGGLTASATKEVNVLPKGSNTPPVACLEANRDSGTTNTYFRFDSTCSYDAEDEFGQLRSRWDFDNDGGWDLESLVYRNGSWQYESVPNKTGEYVDHMVQNKKYSEGGVITVRVEIVDSGGLTDTATKTITVVDGIPNSAPHASLDVDRDSGTVGTYFHFDARDSYDYEDPLELLQVRWDWESDGKWDSGYSPSMKNAKNFEQAGTYNLTMELKDTGGLTDTAKKTITVTPLAEPACGDIFIYTEDVSVKKNDTHSPDWYYENYSNQWFYLDSLEVGATSGGQYFSVEKRDYNSTITPPNKAYYYLRITGKNVNGTQTGIAYVTVNGHFNNGTGCSVKKEFVVEVVDGQSSTLPKCGDIHINAESVSIDEGQNLSKTFSYRNDSKSKFHVDDLEAGRSSSGAYFDVSVANNSASIYPQGQSNYTLSVQGHEISGGDKSGTGYVKMKGHFDGGKTCTYEDIGQRSFGVKVIDGGGGTGTGDCSQISINTYGIEIGQGEYERVTRAINNNSSKKFYVGDVAIDVVNSSLDISIANVSPPSSISSQGQNTFAFDVKADNIEQDTTTQLKYRVRGSFEGGKECYYSNIEFSESLTIKGEGSSDEPSYTMGWYCKDLDTMAFRLSDGGWANELKCKRGCSGGMCDSSGANEIDYSSATAMAAYSRYALAPNPIAVGFLYIGKLILDAIFVTGTVTAVIVIGIFIGEVVIELFNGDVTAYLFPTPNWTQNTTDYVVWRRHDDGWDNDIGKMERECKETLGDEMMPHFTQTSDKSIIAYNQAEKIFAIMNKVGDVINCYRAKQKYVDGKVRRGEVTSWAKYNNIYVPPEAFG